ncbi:MAG: DUF2283 domain-containing protein [Acidobacteria bacterium]|nr:DUF2283 domain-containing protein [Acidobacteriota bacterium]
MRMPPSRQYTVEHDRNPSEVVTHDTVYIRLHETPRTVESDDIERGVIVDYSPEGPVGGCAADVKQPHECPSRLWATSASISGVNAAKERQARHLAQQTARRITEGWQSEGAVTVE